MDFVRINDELKFLWGEDAASYLQDYNSSSQVNQRNHRFLNRLPRLYRHAQKLVSTSEVDAMTFKVGDKVLYGKEIGSRVQATVTQIHKDDPTDLYFTVLLSGRREKQTTKEYLWREIRESDQSSMYGSTESCSTSTFKSTSTTSGTNTAHNTAPSMASTTSTSRSLDLNTINRLLQAISTESLKRIVTTKPDSILLPGCDEKAMDDVRKFWGKNISSDSRIKGTVSDVFKVLSVWMLRHQGHYNQASLSQGGADVTGNRSRARLGRPNFDTIEALLTSLCFYPMFTNNVDQHISVIEQFLILSSKFESNEWLVYEKHVDPFTGTTFS